MPNNADFITNPASSGNSQSNTQATSSQPTPAQPNNLNTELQYLRAIDATLRQILQNNQSASQANVRNQVFGRDDFRRSYSNFVSGRGRSSHRGSSGFTDGIEDALLESVVSSDLRDTVRNSLNSFADMVGTSLEDVPRELGKELGKQIVDKFKDTQIGKQFYQQIDNLRNRATSYVSNAFQQGVSDYDTTHGTNFYQQFTQAYNQRASQSATQSTAQAATQTASQAASNTVLSNAANTISRAAAVADSAADAVQAANTSTNSSASNASPSGLVDTVVDAATGAAASAVADAAVNAAVGQAGGTAAGAAAAGASGAGAALAGLASAAAPLISILPHILVAVVAIDLALRALGPTIESAQNLIEKAGKAANRYRESRKSYVKTAEERLAADIKSMVEAPFQILESAAQSLYDSWDTNLRVINGTQGYSKSDLQDLMSAYAQRLRDENLTDVVSGSDITDNLAKVLSSGLSGIVAEEFAYVATKLNAAIPTQDFFNYADTYASLAANAIKNGKSQSEAIAYANDQIELFASNILYANRELTGGFSTGLSDAQALFKDAVKIAQSNKTSDVADIAGVLTSVAAVTGAIAPDLATSITDAIVQAATGGNSSQIVALRSLAGINASNTEFLKALAKDPQGVFSTLFKNLAKMFNASNDAYMEKAEGYADLFGISMDAFARIDFDYLADAISNMSVNTDSLSENIKHLASGETTLSSEQLKMRQINEYMLDQGLAYVLDNEVARSIQQHMWDEQLAQEMIESTYAVELTGAALEFLEGIRSTIDNILGFLNPFSLIKKVVNLTYTAQESSAQMQDIKQLLELGKVGKGNSQSLHQLTTRGTNLNITDNILTLMGGTSAYEAIAAQRKSIGNVLEPWNAAFDRSEDYSNSSLISAIDKLVTSNITTNFAGRSVYSWGSIGKTTANALMRGVGSYGALLSADALTSPSVAPTSAESVLVSKLNKMLDADYILDNFVSQGKTYEDWAKSATQFGISDLSAAFEAAEFSEPDAQSLFQNYQTTYGQEQQMKRYSTEEHYWTTMEDYTSEMIGLITSGNTILSDLYKLGEQFYNEWYSYFIAHDVYNDAYSYADVQKVKDAEKNKGTDDAVHALAEALVQNSVKLQDPAVQTNVLLSRILLILSAIEQQNNSTPSGLSLADTLAGAALGLTTNTSV